MRSEDPLRLDDGCRSSSWEQRRSHWASRWRRLRTR